MEYRIECSVGRTSIAPLGKWPKRLKTTSPAHNWHFMLVIWVYVHSAIIIVNLTIYFILFQQLLLPQRSYFVGCIDRIKIILSALTTR